MNLELILGLRIWICNLNVKFHLVCVVCFAVVHVFYSVYFHEAIMRLLLCIEF